MQLFIYLEKSSETVLLSNCVENQIPNMEISIIKSGRELIDKCKNSSEDIFIIIDLIMTMENVVPLIEKIKKANSKAKIVVFSTVDSSYIVEKAIGAGADYVTVKPFEIEKFMDTFINFVNGNVSGVFSMTESCIEKRKKAEAITSRVIVECGVYPNVSGFRFLKFSAVEGYFNYNVVDGVTKTLYPILSKCFDTSADKAERAIRHCIEVAWKNGNGSRGFEKLGFIRGDRAKRPTNSEFIFALVEYLKNNI